MKRRLVLILMMAMLFALPAKGASMCACETPDAEQIGLQEATCLKAGTAEMICRTCGASWKEEVPAKGHKWALSQRKEPTCLAAGYDQYACSVCSAIKQNTIMPTGHVWKVETQRDADCIADGMTEYVCEGCGAHRMETTPSLGGHVWSFSIREEPTCKLDGYDEYACDVCGKTKRELIRATGNHTWRTSYIQPAGCEKEGYEEQECAVCLIRKKTALPAAGHSWVQTEETDGSCVELGTKTYSCSVCKERKTETTVRGEHTYVKTGYEAPSCEGKGMIEYTCKLCGDFMEEPVSAAGHFWGDAQIKSRPSCTEEGFAVSICTVCGETEERVLGMTSHEYGEWKTRRKASRKSNGVRERVCAVCGGKEVQEYTLEQARLEKEEEEKKAAAKQQQNNEEQKTVTEKPKETVTAAAQGTGSIEIVTTAAKVNLRTGPGKKNATAGQVAKKNTSLGALIESGVDKDGVVWYHIKYKKKDGWISSKYAKAEFGGLNPAEPRMPVEGSSDLKDVFFCDLAAAAKTLNLTMIGSDAAQSGAVLLRGAQVVEEAQLLGEGYSLHGVTLGMSFKAAKETLEGQGMPCVSGTGDQYLFKRPGCANALFISTDGFDSTIEIELDDRGEVGAVTWKRLSE